MSKNKKSQATTAQSRLREFEAKQQLLGAKANRRKNDNRLALIASAAVVILALGAQVSYSAFGPGSKATPSPTASASASPSKTSKVSAPASAACLNQAIPAGVTKGTAPTSVPRITIAENRTWTGSMYVNGCKLGITLDGAKAPHAVSNFIALAKSGYFYNTYCHRISNSGLFMLQCGDPTGKGTGGPGYSFGPNNENAPASGVYKKGVIAMANNGQPASQGSQFFIVYADSQLSPNYSVLGTVTSGIDKIAALGALGNDGSSSAGGGKPNLDPYLGPIVLN